MVGVLICTAGSGGADGAADAYLCSATRSDTVESATKGAGSAAKTTGGSFVTGSGSNKRSGLPGHGWGSGGVRRGRSGGGLGGSGVVGGSRSGDRGCGRNEGRRLFGFRPRQEGLIKGGRRFDYGWGLRLGLRCCRRLGESEGAGGGEGGRGFTTISGSTGAAFSADGVSPRSRRRIRIRQSSDWTRHDAYPGLPATPGQGNSHVSRETLLRESNRSACAPAKPQIAAHRRTIPLGGEPAASLADTPNSLLPDPLRRIPRPNR